MEAGEAFPAAAAAVGAVLEAAAAVAVAQADRGNNYFKREHNTHLLFTIHHSPKNQISFRSTTIRLPICRNVQDSSKINLRYLL